MITELADLRDADADRIESALTKAEPVASVPDGWREDVSLAAQMLTWGFDGEGLTELQEQEISAHAEKLFAMLATPPTNQEGAAP